MPRVWKELVILVKTVRQRQAVANIKIWLIRRYLRDLTEYYQGDEGRFTRMVVDGGRSLPSAHPAGWVGHIANCAPAAVEFYREELDAIYAQLRAWGHEVAPWEPAVEEEEEGMEEDDH